MASLADEPLAAAAEFEPEEASASYRVDPSAPSEFRFAAPFSVVEEEELVVEVEESFEVEESVPEPADLRPEANIHERTHFTAPTPGLLEPETDFDDLEEDLGDRTRKSGWWKRKRSPTKRSTTLRLSTSRAKTTTCRNWREETLDQEVSVGSAIGDMVRDTHIDQRTDSDASGMLVEEEEAEDELEAAEGVEETEAEEGHVAAVAGQPARRPRDDQRRGGRGQRNDGRRRHRWTPAERPDQRLADHSVELLKQGQEILVQIARSRSQRRVRALPVTSRSLAASWSSCRR